MKRIIEVTFGLVIAGLLFTISGCAKQDAVAAADKTGTIDSAVCQNNVFLQRFGCSLDQVEQAAESNDPDAEYALGYMYYYGIGTQSDPDTAIIWIKRAASQGQPLAIEAYRAIRKSQFPKSGEVIVNAKNKSNPVNATAPKLVTKKVNIKHAESHNNNIASKNHYTIQLLASQTKAKALRYKDLLNIKQPTHIMNTHVNGVDWYVVTVGRYDTRSRAKKAIALLPKSLQNNKPWIRTFSSF